MVVNYFRFRWYILTTTAPKHTLQTLIHAAYKAARRRCFIYFSLEYIEKMDFKGMTIGAMRIAHMILRFPLDY